MLVDRRLLVSRQASRQAPAMVADRRRLSSRSASYPVRYR